MPLCERSDYSHRSATSGSTRDALTAGAQHAANAVTPTVATAAANVGEIGGRHLVEQSCHQLRRCHCTGKPRSDSDERDCHPLSHHHRHHLSSWCAESDSDADLLCSPRYCIRDDAVDADDREQERRQSECTKQRQGQTARCDRIGEGNFEWLHVEQRLGAIDVRKQSPERRCDGHRIGAGCESSVSSGQFSRGRSP